MPSTLLSQLITTDPADTSAANLLAGALRDVKGFLKVYLDVAHDDTGKLKPGAVDSTVLASGSVSGDAITDASITQVKLAADSVDTVQLVDDAVNSDKLADASVIAGKFGPLAIANADLGLQAVKAANIFDHTITALQIAPGTITPTEIAGGSTIPVGTITPSKMTVAAAQPSVLVLGTTTGYHQAATIGGVLSATMVGSVLTFALNSTTSTGATLTHIVQNGTGAITGGAWDTRGSLVRLTGADTIASLSGTADLLNIVSDGTYLILFQATGYLCGDHVAALFHGATVLAVGSLGHSPVAADVQTTSSGFYVLTVAGASTTVPYTLELKTWGAIARGADGQGLATALGGTTANTAQMLLIQL